LTIETQIINSTGKTIISVNMSDNNLVIATIVLAIVTGVLSLITYLYMKETRLMRKLSQSPSFSLEPSMYVLGGTFFQLNIVNTGAIGKNIEIDCMWKKNGETTENRKRIYVLSLSPHGRVPLYNIPIAEIVKDQFLSITIKCEDSRGEEYTEILEKDFSKVTTNGREIGFQFDSNNVIKKSLDDIARALKDVERKIK